MIATVALYQKLFQQNLIEINSITEVLSYTQQADLVVFDIDFTLLTSITQDNVGNSIDWSNINYFEVITNYVINPIIEKYTPSTIQAVQNAGIQADGAQIKKLLQEYIKAKPHLAPLWKKYIHPNSTATPVEKETIEVINTLNTRSIPILLYTARGWQEEKEATEKDLAQAGIKIGTNTLHHKKQIVLPQDNEERGFAFEHGILYWIQNQSYQGPRDPSKTPILLKFFDSINFHPTKIIFVDDLKRRIEDMTKTLKTQDIKATALWYRGIEKKKQKINALSETDLKVLNTYLPEGWQYPNFDQNEAANYVIKQLRATITKPTEIKERTCND